MIWAVIGAVAVVVLSALALALRWYSQSTTMGSPKAERQLAEETAVLAIAAVVLAVAALIAAIVAAGYAKPAFDDYLRNTKTPTVEFTFFAFSGASGAGFLPISDRNGRSTFDAHLGRDAQLQVQVSIVGEATVRKGVFSISVPDDSSSRPLCR